MIEASPKVCVTEHGSVTYRDVGMGYPVLYFHGTGAHSDAALLLDYPLVESNCRLIIPNRPGYGGSALGERGSATFCAMQADRLLRHLGIDRVVAVGTSSGGMPAAAFASSYPQRTAGLVLQCCQAHRWDNRKWMPKGLGWALFLFHHRIFTTLLKWETLRQAKTSANDPRRCLSHMSGDRYDDLADDKDALARISKLTTLSLECARSPTGIENDWAMLVGDNSISEQTIQCPTLIIHDRADPLVPFAHAEWSQQTIAHARLLDVHAGGHLIWFGQDYASLHNVRVEFIHRALAARSPQDNCVNRSGESGGI